MELTETILHALLLEVKPLAVLSGWEPVGIRLESLATAIRGQGPMTERDVTLLRSWGRRWGLLDPEVREFYARQVQAENVTARVCLWRIFEGKRIDHEWMFRRLFQAWEQETGIQPIGIDLCPYLP